MKREFNVTGICVPVINSTCEIRMTHSEKGSFCMKIVGIGKITIDWGDGKTEIFDEQPKWNNFKSIINSDSESSETLEKNFSDENEHTVTVSAIGNVNFSFSCAHNNITSLTSNKYCYYFDCSNNNITSLELNEDFGRFNCSNNKITSLKLPAEICVLDCSNNELTELDFSKVTYLEESVNCSNNKLTSLDTKHIERSIELDCSNNNLSSLKVSSIGDHLLDCSNNNLSASSLKELWDCGCEEMKYEGNPGAEEFERMLEEEDDEE